MPKIDRMLVGEALVGDGNEVAHIDLIIGPRGSPAETAFAMTLTNQKEGVNGLLAVLEPNLMVKPATVMFNKVTIKDAKQAVQMFGPAQRAVAMAVADCRRRGHDPRGRGRGPVHLGGRVHPLGGVGRRQDPAVQLRGHQALDRARGPRRAVGAHRGREEGQVAPSLPGWLKGISGSTKAGARTRLPPHPSRPRRHRCGKPRRLRRNPRLLRAQAGGSPCFGPWASRAER